MVSQQNAEAKKSVAIQILETHLMLPLAAGPQLDMLTGGGARLCPVLQPGNDSSDAES
jgi:hypothetical protein